MRRNRRPREIPKALASILEIVAEGAESKTKRSGGKTYGPAILSGKAAAPEQRRIADGFAGQRFCCGSLDEFKRSSRSREAARLGARNGRRCRGLLREQRIREMAEFDDQLYML